MFGSQFQRLRGQQIPACGPGVERLLTLEWKQRGYQGGPNMHFKGTLFLQADPTS